MVPGREVVEEGGGGVSPNQRDIADFVRSARAEISHSRGFAKAMTPEDFASLLGLTGSMVRKLEAGKATLSGPVEVSIRMLTARPGLQPKQGDLELGSVRAALGELWGFDRPLSRAELARALDLSPEHGDEYLAKREASGKAPGGGVVMAMRLMLASGVPHTMKSVVKPGYPRGLSKVD